jgi:hypothetical protein
MLKKALLFALMACFFFLPLDASQASPLHYQISGTVTNNLVLSEPEYGPLPFQTGDKFEGWLNWDTDIKPDDSLRQFNFDEPLHFLELSLNDIAIVLDYSYLNVGYSSDGYAEAINLDHLGYRYFEEGDIRYRISEPYFNFAGGDALATAMADPFSVDFANYSEALFNFSMRNFTDLTDGTTHYSLFGWLELNVDRIEAVPEPSVLVLLAAGLAGLIGLGRKRLTP